MRHDIVVAERRYDWNRKVIGRVLVPVILALSKHLGELLHHQLILLYDLLLCAWNLLVVIVSRRITRPDDKIYAVFQILFNPLERLVDQRYGCVAAGRLRAVDSRRSAFPVTCRLRLGTRICLEKWVGVNV